MLGQMQAGAGMKKLVAVNANGLRIGQDHQHAVLTDEECERIRELHREGLSYKTLAMKFEVSKSTIAMICRYARRGELPARWKTVHVPGKADD